MRYEVVVANSLEVLLERVRGRISGGWRPLGGVSLAPELLTADRCGIEAYTFAQAVVKEVLEGDA